MKPSSPPTRSKTRNNFVVGCSGLSEGFVDEHQSSDFENAVTFHHVGYVVKSIEVIATNFAQSLSLLWNGEIFYDPLQGARVSFFQSSKSGNPTIELVAPEGTGSPVYRFLQQGGGLHHLCYEVDSLEKQLHHVRSNGDLIVRRPLPAVAFGGRRITWVYTRNKLLVEYLERVAH